MKIRKTEILLFAVLLLISGLYLLYEKEVKVTDTIKIYYEETSEAAQEGTEKVNINTANQEELMALKGIGEVLSSRIIEFRETYGAFQSVDELLDIEGFNSVIYEKILPYVTVEEE